MAPPLASENRLLPGYGAGCGDHAAARVELDAVEDDEAAAGQRIAGHERFRQEVQAGAVDHHARAAHGVDQRPAGGVAQDVDLAALGAIHEGLARRRRR